MAYSSKRRRSLGRAGGPDPAGGPGAPARRTARRRRHRFRAPVSRPAVSRHLRVLKGAGLVTERKDSTGISTASIPTGCRAPHVPGELLDRSARRLQGGRRAGRRNTVNEPINASVTVRRSPETRSGSSRRTSALVAAQGFSMAEDTYADRGVKAETIVFEERAGGRVYEVMSDGTKARRPRSSPSTLRDRSSWRGSRTSPTTRRPSSRSRLPDGDGTRVDLEHRGWSGSAPWRRRRAPDTARLGRRPRALRGSRRTAPRGG